jgi:hypothetical protein
MEGTFRQRHELLCKLVPKNGHRACGLSLPVSECQIAESLIHNSLGTVFGWSEAANPQPPLTSAV